MSNYFTKGRMIVDGNDVTISMPFAKRDVEKRTVSGYATLDNVDTQGDVVLAEASRKAFERARGNLREMHEKKAVGRIIDFKETEYLDQESGELYRGIWVTAYVSKGAQDTWEKVLDGTLSGFSIGGEINEAESEFVKDAGKTIRFVKDYDLTELSLVDNPANQLANVASIQKSLMTMQKSATGSVTVEGIIAETKIESVFVCENPDHEDIIHISSMESIECPVCEQKMDNIGWFESVENESGKERAEKVKEIVTKYLTPTETEAASTSEGGVEMGFIKSSKTPVEKSTPATEEQPEEVTPAEPSGDAEVEDEGTEAADVDEAAEQEGETLPAEDAEEVEDDSTVLEKKFDELSESIKATLEAGNAETLEKVAELEAKIDEVHESFTKKASELETRVSGIGEKLEAAKGRLAEFEKALDKVNSSDAVRKSADLDNESEAAVTKAREFRWGTGTFSGDTLFK